MMFYLDCGKTFSDKAILIFLGRVGNYLCILTKILKFIFGKMVSWMLKERKQ